MAIGEFSPGGGVSGTPSRDRLCGGELELKPGHEVSSSEAARVRLGASTATEPDMLRSLADDPSVTVRAGAGAQPRGPVAGQ